MLTEKQREQLRDVLKGEMDRLLRNAQDGLQFAMNRDREKVGRDSIDESMEEELFSTELRLRDREKFLIGKINGALERLDKNSIDECEECSTWFDGMRVIVSELARFRRSKEPEVATAVLAGVREGLEEDDGRGG
mgnify:CR=1 FL=1